MKDFSFENFSRLPFFIEVNNRLVNFLNVKEGQKIVDLACGTGAVTELLLQRVRNIRDIVILAIDNSTSALNRARKNLKDLSDKAVRFVQAQAEELNKNIPFKVDTVIFCNAIHYIHQKENLIREIRHILNTGGYFAFNTSFFKGAHPPETEAFYRRWMFKSLRMLRREYNIKPQKNDKTQARKQLEPREYKVLLEKNNFVIKIFNIHKVQMPLEGWIYISQFKDFISGVMPGVPLQKASYVLRESVKRVYDSMGIQTLPRNWLECVVQTNA